MYKYIYIYIYINVCVCGCVCERAREKETKIFLMHWLHLELFQLFYYSLYFEFLSKLNDFYLAMNNFVKENY